MRAIFLDFDGVLHDPDAAAGLSSPPSSSHLSSSHLPDWPPQSVRDRLPRAFTHASLLAQVLADAPDVRIVATSPWTLRFTDCELTRIVPELSRWIAGSLAPGPRPAMIRDWMSENAVQASLVLDADVQKYVRRDWPQLVPCNPVLGFAEPRVVESVMRWLRVSERAVGASF